MFNVHLVFPFIAIVLIAVGGVRAGIPGGVSKLTGKELEEAKNTLQNSLNKLAAGEGPKYKLTKLISATVQVVSGSLHRIRAELEDENRKTKLCDIAIWSQPWLENGIEVTFDCEGEPKLVKKHSA